MRLLKRVFHHRVDPDLVSRPEFDRHTKSEKQQRDRLAKRLRAMEYEMENLARVERLPGQGG